MNKIKKRITTRKLLRHTRNMILKLIKYVFIIGICFTILYPLLTKFSLSLMDQRDLFDKTVKVIPNTIRLDNYPEIITYIKFWQVLFNTAWLSLLTAILQTISCVAVGYGFAKFNFKGKNLLFICVLIAMVVPPQITITPLYLNFKSFNLFGLIPKNFFLGNPLSFVLLSITASAPRCGL
jgi:multiple sugar transport system permease protein